jgi:quercetin dioxygenase-like cupin family protein
MKAIRMMAAVALVGCSLTLHDARSHQPAVQSDLQQHEAVATAPVECTAGSAQIACLRESVTVAADKPIPNLPGKRLVSLVVEYPPGVSSPPHRHAPSAFIYAYVLEGKIRSQVDDEPARVYLPGEGWSETPGARHRVSANASETERAGLLAVFIVDAADDALTAPDHH